MYRGLIYIGRRGIAIHAISGIDIALWDIRGKALGKPVCELLGEVRRDRVRAYASMLMPETTEETAERVGALRERGFTAVKLGWGPLGRDPEHDVRLAAAAKEAGGAGEQETGEEACRKTHGRMFWDKEGKRKHARESP